MSKKRALTKFLCCVKWSDSDVQEAKQAVELMGRWEAIDVCNALEYHLFLKVKRSVHMLSVFWKELMMKSFIVTYFNQFKLFGLSILLGVTGSGDEDGFKLWQSLVYQTELTAQLCSIMRDVRNVRGGTYKKIERLRQLLFGLLSELTYFEEPIRSPLALGILITGIVPSESSIFLSALHPLHLTFRTANGGSCKIIFKKGDDLRQDQLVD